MNLGWLSFHLREASEELARTLAEIETNPDFREIELKIAFEHLYNHLNTAWNSRNVGDERFSAHSREEFYAWRAFPSDINMANG
ncbi:MAG TPA: hypothetical protein VHR72_09215 [Gemmataceae bacterium]|jgi:hypothetical protein|nr:hypothetical protein [Gemmataceae bacterium]